jgi:hypothetical protein
MTIPDIPMQNRARPDGSGTADPPTKPNEPAWSVDDEPAPVVELKAEIIVL